MNLIILCKCDIIVCIMDSSIALVDTEPWYIVIWLIWLSH